jgi:hypothetical protein
MIRPGDYVKVIFVNQGIVSGTVIEWSDKISVLQLEDGDEFVINKTVDNVVAVKISRHNNEEINKPKRILKSPKVKFVKEESNDFPSDKELKQQSDTFSQNLRAKRLTDLYMEKSHAEKEAISKKATSFEISDGAMPVRYIDDDNQTRIPRALAATKPGPFNNTRKKNK